jgi:hypothetical protein
MGKAFWVKRFLLAAGGVFALLALVYLAKGRPLEQAMFDAVVWALITSIVYLGVLRYRTRQNPQCAIGSDAPGMQ